MNDIAIESDGLTKYYGEQKAVTDLSLSIPRGTIYGFLGPNGAGKTTTMRLLTALTEPTSGHAALCGIPITNRSRLTEKIGYLPADPPVFEQLTGREQLEYVGRLQELSPSEASDRIERWLERFDLAADADRRISEYSTGMRKKIGVIGAILHDPDVVFLDEPTTGLDPSAAQTMRETIRQLASQNITVFLSSHILPVVDKIADTVGVINDGELIAEGTPAELRAQADSTTDTDLESAFLQITTKDQSAKIPNTERGEG